ncbi:calcium/sodium antiporter (plasmid) [Limimaricola variabilis]
MMDMWLPLIGGLVLLISGGDLLVRGAVQVAERLGVSPLVIGLTLVGFGTSTPELVTSVQAALSGSPGIAFGNIVGSNIANILLILGISALILPIAVPSSALRRDAVVMLGVAAVFAALSFAMPLGRLVGVALIAALIAYIYLAFRQESASADHGAAYDKAAALEAVDPGLHPKPSPSGGMLTPLLLAVGGLVLVVVGGAFLVKGAVAIAQSFGIPETVIGLTIVAVGTSMPELVTSVVAAFKRQSDVAFGNIVGSNIYNILGIGGGTALISPTRVPEQIVTFDNLLMVGVSLLLVLFAATGLRIARWEGAVLLAGYLVYLYVLWP